MKKRIIGLILAVALVCVGAIGGTLAYFTAQDKADNVFTVGNVKIELQEIFDPNEAQLLPGKDIAKEIKIINTGNNAAYVRVLIAIPTAIDDGDPNFDASRNFLHFNFSMNSVAAGQWSWLPNMTDGTGYDKSSWNFAGVQKIDGIDYNVYIVTYRTVLNPTETTLTPAIYKVYLDKTVNAKVNSDGSMEYFDNKGNTITISENEKLQIKVLAQAVQAEGFDNAYAAFAEAEAVGNISSNPWQ